MPETGPVTPTETWSQQWGHSTIAAMFTTDMAHLTAVTR